MTLSIRRRELIAALGGAAAVWPLAARAQQGERVQRIGVLLPHDESDPEEQVRLSTFRQELTGLGWAVGRNIKIDVRFAAADGERIRAYAAELARSGLDAILVDSSRVLAEVQHVTRTVPIVFVQVTDPVAQGFVSNLARPGANITGFSSNEYAISGKWLQMLKEIAPRIARVAAIVHADNPSSGYLEAAHAAAAALRVELIQVGLRDAAEIEPSFDLFAHEPNGGLLVITSPFITVHRDLIAALAIKHRLPSIHGFRFFAISGGLMSYGHDPVDLYRRAAAYIDRILRGEKPGDLPVQLPIKYQLVINLKTAKAIGLAVPQSFLALADEVIE
jgi:putative ABC transport system substrate-binding protein